MKKIGKIEKILPLSYNETPKKALDRIFSETLVGF